MTGNPSNRRSKVRVSCNALQELSRSPKHLPPASYPIAEAPIEAGEHSEPVLLWPGDEQGNWRIGWWNGIEWANEDDEIVAPSRYALLPATPAPPPPVPHSLPIETATAEDGVKGEPCLLWAAWPRRSVPRWMIGWWTGSEWRDEEGLHLEPEAWAPLPCEPVLQEAKEMRHLVLPPEAAANLFAHLYAVCSACPRSASLDDRDVLAITAAILRLAAGRSVE